MANLPSNFPALLRAAGLTVVEVDNWKTRGRLGLFEPVGALNHHTGASAKNWSRAKELAYAKWMFLVGRSDLSAPLCQIALGRSGVVYLGAAGRANHAGKARASGSVAAGDGNRLYVGIEWMLSGTEKIPAKMMAAGVRLNAVITEKVTKTSVRTISCHYNTSVTGKWDIGDPNGIDFAGHKVLDTAAFRVKVQAERLRLYGKKPINPPVVVPPKGKKVRVAAGHISLQFNDTLEQREHDIDVVFAQGRHYLGGTEALEASTKAALAKAALKYGYRVWVRSDCWLAVKVNRVDTRYEPYVHWHTVIPGVAGRYPAKGVFSVRVWDKVLDKAVTAMVAHAQTKGDPGGKTKESRQNIEQNRALMTSIGKHGASRAKTGDIVLYLADQNMVIGRADTMFGQPFVPCWKDVGHYPNTGHGCIDGIFRCSLNKNVLPCVGAKAYNDRDMPLYGDHFYIAASYDVVI